MKEKTYDEILQGARLLVDNCELYNAEEVIDYFEKPWKWDEEIKKLEEEEKKNE